jgi:hypothetical protein
MTDVAWTALQRAAISRGTLYPMSKAKLGELFFKERALKVSVGSRRMPAIAISERILRNLITGLILLFLVTLATAMFLQLSASRDRSIQLSNDKTSLVLRAAAGDLSAALGIGLGRRPAPASAGAG